MKTIVSNYTYKEPDVDLKEALRYAGMREEDEGVTQLLLECYAVALPKLSYRVCCTELDVECEFVRKLLAVSETARARLSGASSVLLLAATVGIELDRLIARCGVASPTRALLYQALGAERIESLCDAFCRDMAEKKSLRGLELTPRFSPGYGDIDLSLQRDVFALLDCQRQIGLTLNESLLMSPSKSITALMGVRRKIDAR